MSIKEFLFVNDDGFYEAGYVEGSISIRNCDSGVSVGDIVCESSSLTNGVDKLTNNKDVRSAIGWVFNKPTSTSAEILFDGLISGLSGLAKSGKVFLSSSGGFTSTKETEGYLHILGHAVDADKFDFNPVNTKVKIYKPGFDFPLSYNNIVPSNLEAGSNISDSMDMDGNTLVIGTSKKHFYVFTYDISSKTWTQEAKIVSPDTNPESFGKVVRIYNNTIVVTDGSYSVNGYTSNGRAYIYTRSGTTWTLKATIDGPNEDNLYHLLADIYNDIIIIGSNKEDANSYSNNGVVRIYEFDGSNVTLKQTINGPNENNYYLGESGICVENNLLSIASYRKNTVHVYKYNGSSWVLDETISDSTGYFGKSISLNNNRLVVGADTNQSTASNFPGAFYVYTYDGTNWNGTGAIFSSHNIDGDHFGWDVSIYDDYIVVGAPYEDVGGDSDVGRVYFFEYDGTNWTEKQVVSGLSDSDFFGKGVYTYNNHIFASSLDSDLTVSNGGEIRDYKNS